MFWVGDVKADGSVPAWVFYIADPKDIAPLKGILVKTIQETNFIKMQEQLGQQSSKTKSTGESNEQDMEWLES